MRKDAVVNRLQRFSSAVSGGIALKNALRNNVTAYGITHWLSILRRDAGFTMTVRVLRSLELNPRLSVSWRTIRGDIAGFGRYHYSNAVGVLEAERYLDASKHFLESIRLDLSVGLRAPWSCFQNLANRIIKPYVAVIYCGWSLARGAISRAWTRCQT